MSLGLVISLMVVGMIRQAIAYLPHNAVSYFKSSNAKNEIMRFFWRLPCYDDR
jgi:hypothetical protein